MSAALMWLSKALHRDCFSPPRSNKNVRDKIVVDIDIAIVASHMAAQSCIYSPQGAEAKLKGQYRHDQQGIPVVLD